MINNNLLRLDKITARPKCKRGKPCGDICIPKKFKCTVEGVSIREYSSKEEKKAEQISKSFNVGKVVAKGVVAGTITTGLSAAVYMKMRSNYQNHIKKTALMAQGKAVGLDVPNELYGGINGGNTKEKARQMTFVVGGFSAKGGDSSRLFAEQLSPNSGSSDEGAVQYQADKLGISPDLFQDHYVVPINNKEFDVQHPLMDLSKHPTLVAKSHAQTVLKHVLNKNYNPVSLDTAAQIYAHHQKHPDLPINLIGYSGGGMTTHETAQILQELKIPNVKVVNFGSPYFGLTNDTGNTVTFVTKNDELFKIPGSSVRNPIVVNEVEDHASYLQSAKVRRLLRLHLDRSINLKSNRTWLSKVSKMPEEIFDPFKQTNLDSYYYGFNDSLRLDKKPVCKKGKVCGDICIPKKYNCEENKNLSHSSNRSKESRLNNYSNKVQKQFNLTNVAAKGVMVGAVATGTSVAAYVGFRAKYQQNIKKSAVKAKEMAEKYRKELPYKAMGGINGSDESIEANHVTFVIGGFAGQKGKHSETAADQFRPNKDSINYKKYSQEAEDKEDFPDLFEDHHVIPVDNKEFDIKHPLGSVKYFGLRNIPGTKGSKNAAEDLDYKLSTAVDVADTMLLQAIKKGHNPVAVETAARAYAYHQRFPDKQINLIGRSGGGMATHEASQILKEMGVTNVKVVNLGSPYWGITKDEGNAITFTSKNDEFFKQPGLAIRNPVAVDSVPNHDSYLQSPEVRRLMNLYFKGEIDFKPNHKTKQNSVWLPKITKRPNNTPSKLTPGSNPRKIIENNNETKAREKREAKRNKRNDPQYQKELAEKLKARKRREEAKKKEAKKDSYNHGIQIALRYDNRNKKLRCRPGFIQIGAVCQRKKSTQTAVNMAIKTAGDAELPSRKEVARLAGQLLGDFVRDPIQATKDGLERERLVREELKNRGYDLPDNTELAKQAVVEGAKKTKDYVKNNPEALENLAVNTAGFAASKVGGALLGPLGGFGGDLLGALSVRKGLTDYKAYKAAAEKLSTDQAYQSANKLKKLAMLRDATIGELESIEFRALAQNNLAGDVEGWAIGNTAAEVIGIPLSGATVVMTTTEPLLTTFREEKYQNNKSNLEAAKEAFKKIANAPKEAIKAGNEREAKFREQVNEQLRELRDNILKSN